jgi:N-acetylmuramoyl-L-alanine amidase
MSPIAPLLSLWFALLLGMFPGVADALRPGLSGAPAFELRNRGRALGQIAPAMVDSGQSYVAAERLAAMLGGSWFVRGARGSLTVGSRSAHFTRDAAGVVVQGQAIGLGSSPRVVAGAWLLPDDFLEHGLGRLVPGVTAVKLTTASPPTAPAPLTSAKPAAPPPRAPMAVRTPEPADRFEDLRYRSYPSFTRVVVEASGPVRPLVVPGAQSILVRLPGLAVAGPRVEAVDDGLVKQVRLESADADGLLRIVLDGPAGEVKTMALEDPYRLVVDVYRPRSPVDADATRPSGQALRLIVIDPGHGGHDPGAIGPSGLAEKEVVLDVSRRLTRMVEEGLGIKVVTTRNTDVFIPLRDRTNFANKQRADLFVSIHANAHPHSISEGVETYFLSSEATDKEARQVAAIENGVVQLESPTQRQKTDVLKSILWDLAQSEFQQESSFMAETLQDLMTRSLGLVNRGVKQAGFYVLGGAAMPAVLIEVGFLTNPREEKKLASPAHREAVATAIYAGLAEYKRRHDQRMRAAQPPAPRIEAR